MTTVADDVQTRELRHVLQTYRRQPVTFVRGDGVRLYDIEGRDYLDLLSGIGVSSLGYGHPRLVRAIAEQAQTLMHTSNLFYHPLQGELAERLASLSGLPRAFFCNSGTEAVEACLKFARRYWHTRGEKRSQIIAFEESFHGRTIGALSVTSDEHYREPFEPLLAGVTWLPIDDPARLLATVSRDTAAIIVEPIQGEGGVRPVSPAFAAAINEASQEDGRDRHRRRGPVGNGRTGYPFYFGVIGLKPHLVSLGKALGGGVPVGAVLLSDEVASTISYGDHGTTYGGNLLACRAALCVLDELVDGGLMAHVGTVGRHMEARLRALAAKHPFIKEVRGAGVMWGLELTRDAGPVVPAGLERRRHRQPHGGDGGAPAAAARHHRAGARRGPRPAGCGAGGRGGTGMTSEASNHAARGGRRRRQGAARADCRTSRRRASAAARSRRAHRPRVAVRRRGPSPQGHRLRRTGAAQQPSRRSPVACRARKRPPSGRRHRTRQRAAAACPRGRVRTAVRADARARSTSPICGFSIVPHLWVQEKVFTDCVSCPKFRTCGQFAMVRAARVSGRDPRSARRSSPFTSHEHLESDHALEMIGGGVATTGGLYARPA